MGAILRESGGALLLENGQQLGLDRPASCLLLLKDSDATHVLPLKDQAGCYKRGDIVEVLDDSKHDGNLAANPIAAPFYLIRILGITKAQALRFMESDYTQQFQLETRRGWSIPIDLLPAVVKTRLSTTRYYETTLAAIRTFIRYKRTGETA